MKRAYLLPILIFWAALSAPGCASRKIPDSTDRWRVEVGPAGNESYEPPPPLQEPEAPGPQLLEMVRRIAPAHAEIKRWEFQGSNRYFIRAEAPSEEYDFLLSPDGLLLRLDYENDQTNVTEEPGKMVLRGTRKKIRVSEVPGLALQTLKTVFPNAQPSSVWKIQSPAGARFVVLVDGLAFFARPDGQIQAAAPVASGALNEIDLRDLTPPAREEIIAEAASKLGPYSDKFNFQKQIGRLPTPGSSFRFVVMGDSRSNAEVWDMVVKHIGALDPKPAFIINTGDIVLRGYTREYLEYFLPPLKNMDIPLFVAIGNHDDGDSAQALEYRALFGDESLNYFFDYGKWRFVFIDNSSSVQPSSKTLDWLREVLWSTPKDHSLVVSAHKPIANIKKWAYHSWEPEASARFAELMSRHRVKHVFFGHIHAYSTASLDGVPYTIAGGGGAPLHNRYGPEGSVHHYLICDVAADGTLEQRVVRFYRK
jgi:hypothetical protein